MPARESSSPTNSPPPASSAWVLALGVGLGSVILFAADLGDEPFVDEYAYLTQSYQGDRFFSGNPNDPAWLEGLSFDLVPLPKYLIALALRAAGYPRPSPEAAAAWYRNTHYRWGPPEVLAVARIPSVVMGAAGCVALFALGSLAVSATAGLVAAALLALNPLYRLHAHRAMSEAPCEAFLLLALVLGLWGWRRMLSRGSGFASWILLVGGGVAAGMSVLAKFTGLLAILTLWGWVALGVALPGVPSGRKLAVAAAALAALVMAAAVFVALNPFLTARPSGALPAELRELAELSPLGRFRFLIDHRRVVSRDQQERFSHNALKTLSDRVAVVAVQGFGRFGPLGPARSDSTRRFDARQDWGAAIWLPLVVLGAVATVRRGRVQLRGGSPPTAWAVAVWAAVAVAAVTAYLPLAWDRYLLPIQAPAALLAAQGFVAGGSWLFQSVRRLSARS
jgi:4-amino-4-deoxy-L-arabinose transferase-like glycosyltransferase